MPTLCAAPAASTAAEWLELAARVRAEAPERAAACVRDAALADPTSTTALRELGNLQLEARDYVAASSTYRRALSLAPDDCVLSAEQVEQWRTQRYLVLDGLFPARLIAEAVACHTEEFPTPTPERPSAELAGDAGGGFGGIGTSREFPFDVEHDVYNMLTLHPRALKTQLLGTSDLRVTHSNYGAKYGGRGFEKPRTAPDQNGWDASVTGDQTMHWDFGNNTMLDVRFCCEPWHTQA